MGGVHENLYVVPTLITLQIVIKFSWLSIESKIQTETGFTSKALIDQPMLPA